MKMRVLVACECSGVVRDAFAALGHQAMSCDLKPCEVSYGEHYQGDVLRLLRSEKFDLMVAHPPCTYLSNVGAKHLYRCGVLQPDRFMQGVNAKAFFMQLLSAPVSKICIENPTPLKIFGLPPPDDVVQPYFFGEPFKKRTCLWLRGLPPLISFMECVSKESAISSCWYNLGNTAKRQTNRSRTFLGMARAMANQWGAM